MKRQLFLALGLAAASLGCTGLRNAPEIALDVETPQAWEAAEPGAGAPASAAAAQPGSWWHTFGDPRLDRLIELAFDANRDLRSASARVDAALAQARIAGANRKPQADVSASAARRKQNFIGLPIPGTEGRVLSNTSTSLGTALNVSWEADLWGRLGDGTRAAGRRAQAVSFDFEAARLSLAGQTAKSWFAFLESASQVELADEILTNRSRVRERIERRYRQGLRSALDLRLATADQANAEARLAARARQHDTIRRQLQLLLARDEEAMQILERASRLPADLPELSSPPSPGTPSEALSRRPDLQASERRLAAAGLDVAGARKLLYPRLALSGSTGTTSQEAGDLLNTDFSVWSLAAGLVQPLFQGGRLRAGVELSEAALSEALARHEGAVLRALTEVETQLAGDRYLGEQQAAVARAGEAAAAAEKLAQNRYFTGLADYLRVLAAQEQATAASSQLLEINRQRLEQRVDLYLALGGTVAATSAPKLTTDPNEES